MFTSLTPVQAPGRFKAQALRGLAVSPSVQARVVQLAAQVRQVRPAVYIVGACTVDHWRGSCSCKARRTCKARPCVHQLAVWLAELVEVWQPISGWLLQWYQSHGIEQPGLAGWCCRLAGARGMWQYVEPAGEGWVYLLSADGTTTTAAPIADVTHLQPVYEE